jgi:hypothetical protein
MIPCPFVIPAYAGTQGCKLIVARLGSRLRGNDSEGGNGREEKA